MKLKLLVIYTILLSILSFQSYSNPKWQPDITPNDAWINDLTFYGGNFFACDNGIFKSSDYGGSWSITTKIKINDTIIDGYNKFHFYRIVTTTKTFVASIQGGGYVISSDEGKLWLYYSANELGDIKVLYYFDSTLYAGSTNGFFKSTDNGYTWINLNKQINLENLSVFDINSDKDSNLYICTRGFVFKIDRIDGKSEKFKINSDTNLNVNCIAFLDSVYYIGTDKGIFRSSNNGENWEWLTKQISEKKITTIATEFGRIFVGTIADGLFESNDTAKTWVQWVDYKFQPISLIKSLGNSPLFLIGYGVYYEFELDHFWEFGRYGCGFPIIKSIYFNKYNQLIYLSNANLFNSHPMKPSVISTITWKLPSAKNILFVGDNNSNTLFYCDTNNIMYSSEGAPFTTGLEYRNNWLASDSIMHNIKDMKTDAIGNLYAINIKGDMFYSTDNGKLWTKSIDVDSVKSINVDNTGNNIIAIQKNNLFIIYNYGNSWMKYPNKFPDLYKDTCYNFLMYNNRIISTGGSGIYYTDDFGIIWNKSIGTYNSRYFKLLSVGAELYCTSDTGVFRSLDSGKTWADYSDGLPIGLRQCKEIAVDRNGFLYIGTDYYGMYKSVDSVTCVSENITDATNIEISPNPATDFIEISVGANGPSPLQNDVRIYNVFGQTVSTPVCFADTPAQRGTKNRCVRLGSRDVFCEDWG